VERKADDEVDSDLCIHFLCIHFNTPDQRMDANVVLFGKSLGNREANMFSFHAVLI
jgi:hypothetical protein